jgi:proteasome lid subunit RPN8/RPN11
MLAVASLTRVHLFPRAAQTLVREMAAHHASDRRMEEKAWLLFGRFRNDVAIIKAVGSPKCDASPGHVMVDHADAIRLALEMRRQDRSLTIIGMMHTHTDGSDEPSFMDLLGDRQWIDGRADKRGVFGIGTPDGHICWFGLTADTPHYYGLSVGVE